MTKKKIAISTLAIALVLSLAIALLGVALITSRDSQTYSNGDIKLTTVADETYTVQGYKYAFGTETKVDGLTFSFNMVYEQYGLLSVSEEDLNSKYGKDKWKFVKSNGDKLSYSYMGSGSESFIKFNELPAKFLCLDTNAKKAVYMSINSWGQILDTDLTTFMYFRQLDFNGIYQCDTAKEDLDKGYGEGGWAFFGSSGKKLQYTFSGSPGGKSYLKFSELPAKFQFNAEMGEPTSTQVKFNSIHVGSGSPFPIEFYLEQKNNYLIIPDTLDVIDVEEIDYLGYRVIDYSSKPSIKITFADNSTSLKIPTIFVDPFDKASYDFNDYIQANKFYERFSLGLKSNYAKYYAYDFVDKNLNPVKPEDYMPSGSQTPTLVSDSLPLFVIIYADDNVYNISYKLNGGTWYITQPPTQVSNWGVTEIPKPSKQGYIFEGWYDNPDFTGDKYEKIGKTLDIKYTLLTKDITLYAKWSPVTNEIQYKLNGGTIENIEDYTSYISGTNMDLPTPSMRGYRFIGWYMNDDDSIVFNKLEADVYYGNPIILKAKWEEILYKITYKQNGGTFYITEPPRTYGVDGVKIPTTSRQGYIFKGWYLDEALTDFLEDSRIPADFVISGDITLWAKWSPVLNDINFELNGGTIENIEDYNKYLSGTDMELPIPVKEGYEFLGWYMNNGDTKVDSLQSDVYYGNPIILSAKWEIKKFIVSYYVYGNAPLYLKEYEYGQEFDDLGIWAISVQDGKTFNQYKFLGWSVDVINVSNFDNFTAETKINKFEGGSITSDLKIYGYYYLYSKQNKFSLKKQITIYADNNLEATGQFYNPTVLNHSLVVSEPDDKILDNSAENNESLWDKTKDSISGFFNSLKEKTSNYFNQYKTQFIVIGVIIIIIIVGAIVLKIIFK